MVAGRRAAVEVGCEEVEEERARVGGDAVVLCLWLNVEPVRLMDSSRSRTRFLWERTTKQGIRNRYGPHKAECSLGTGNKRA